MQEHDPLQNSRFGIQTSLLSSTEIPSNVTYPSGTTPHRGSGHPLQPAPPLCNKLLHRLTKQVQKLGNILHQRTVKHLNTVLYLPTLAPRYAFPLELCVEIVRHGDPISRSLSCTVEVDGSGAGDEGVDEVDDLVSGEDGMVGTMSGWGFGTFHGRF